jgi:predicted nicotinamide N-methyase
LAIQGRHFADSIVAVDSDDEENRIISINVAGRAALRLHQRINDRDAATAGSVWDGALFMVKFLERHALEWLHNRTVLELGSGVGLVGIAAGVLGARRVILTDLHPNLDLLQRNIRENECHWKTTGGGGGGGSVSGCERMVCRECDWNCPPGRLSTSESDDGDGERADVILVADCVWVDPLVEPLLSTVVAFATTTRTKTHHREDVRVLFSYQRRGKSTDELFWTGLRRRFASVDILDDENLGQPVSLQLISCRHPAL